MKTFSIGTIFLFVAVIHSVALGEIIVPEVLQGEFITENKDMSFVVEKNGANKRSSFLISNFIKRAQQRMYYSHGANNPSDVPFEVESEMSESADQKSVSLDITVRVGRFKPLLFLSYAWQKIEFIYNKEDQTYRLRVKDGSSTTLLIVAAVGWSRSTTYRLERIVREDSPHKISGLSAEGIDFGSTNIKGTLPLPVSMTESVSFNVKFEGLSVATIQSSATGIISYDGRDYLVPADFANVANSEVIFKIPKVWVGSKRSIYANGMPLKIFAGKFRVFTISLANLRGSDDQIKTLVVRFIPSFPVLISFKDKESALLYPSLTEYAQSRFGEHEMMRGLSTIMLKMEINGQVLMNGANSYGGFVNSNDDDTTPTSAQFKVTYLSDRQSSSRESVFFSTSDSKKISEIVTQSEFTTHPVFIASRQEIKEVKVKLTFPLAAKFEDRKSIGYISNAAELTGESLDSVFSSLKSGITFDGKITKQKD